MEFEMTGDGYSKAKAYLEEVGKLKEFMNNKTSLDGYSLVAFANVEYDRREKAEKS